MNYHIADTVVGVSIFSLHICVIIFIAVSTVGHDTLY
jgi:hypothetical protein